MLADGAASRRTSGTSPICMVEERHRKSIYNFQQLSYDPHEWDYDSWSWTGQQPQRMKWGEPSAASLETSRRSRTTRGSSQNPEEVGATRQPPAASAGERRARCCAPFPAHPRDGEDARTGRSLRVRLQAHAARARQTDTNDDAGYRSPDELDRDPAGLPRPRGRRGRRITAATSTPPQCDECDVKAICDGFHGDYAVALRQRRGAPDPPRQEDHRSAPLHQGSGEDLRARGGRAAVPDRRASLGDRPRVAALDTAPPPLLPPVCESRAASGPRMTSCPVSVVITTHNRADILSRCVRATLPRRAGTRRRGAGGGQRLRRSHAGRARRAPARRGIAAARATRAAARCVARAQRGSRGGTRRADRVPRRRCGARPGWLAALVAPLADRRSPASAVRSSCGSASPLLPGSLPTSTRPPAPTTSEASAVASIIGRGVYPPVPTCACARRT